MKKLLMIAIAVGVLASAALAQDRRPSTASHPFVVTSKQQVSDIQKVLAKKSGNTSQDIVAAAGDQMRAAIFHDARRVDDNVELHDTSDDIYYVLDGTATLMLGGTLDSPKEVSQGEWRAKTVTGGQKVVIRKGDLIVVPRGTPHQRTVTGRGFSMILIKVFATEQPAK